MTKQIFKPVLFWIMTLGLLWSCQEPLESPLDTTDLSLQEAQSFYEEIQAQAKILSQNSKADKRTKKTTRQAFWDKQEKYKLGNQELISIPVLFDDDLNTPGYGFKKMVFYKDTKTNKTNARIIEYVFDKDYLSKNFGNLSMKTFTGMMIVYDAEGNYLEGLAVKDGKQTNKVGVALDGVEMKAKNANGRESATTSNCETSYTGYGCDFGGGALGGASNTGYTPNDLLTKCSVVYIQFLGNCGGGSGGSTSGFPYTLPAPVSPNPFDTFSGFAGGGGGGYVYMGPQIIPKTEKQLYDELALSYGTNPTLLAPGFLIPEIYKILYPKLTRLINNLPYFVQTDAKVKESLIKWSGLTYEQIKLFLEYGSGPALKVSSREIPGARGRIECDSGDGDISCGEKEKASAVVVDLTTVRELEGSTDVDKERAISFLLAVTILHETIHYSRRQAGLPDPSKYYPDYGTYFESGAFGVDIQMSNSRQYLYRLYKL